MTSIFNGLATLIGLAAKSAALKAARLQLRPIVMTSLFHLGAMLLAVFTGRALSAAIL